LVADDDPVAEALEGRLRDVEDRLLVVHDEDELVVAPRQPALLRPGAPAAAAAAFAGR
jgi:hypothetical protein